MPWQLGVTLGRDHIGWAAINVSKHNNSWRPDSIRDAGVRVFSDGRDPKTKKPNSVKRRMARSSRRNYDRYKNRRIRLMKELVRFGLMPQHDLDRKSLEVYDPWILRTQGLDQRLNIHQFGRSLFHLHKHRGYKPNRKIGFPESKAGKVNAAIKRTSKIQRQVMCPRFCRHFVNSFLLSSRTERVTTSRTYHAFA